MRQSVTFCETVVLFDRDGRKQSRIVSRLLGLLMRIHL